MAKALICTNEFGPFKKGDIVVDPAEIAKWSETHDVHFVATNLPDDHDAVKAHAEKAAAPSN